MRNDEEFRKEVFKRCEQKRKSKKAARKNTALLLCLIAVVCAAAVPVYFNNVSPSESNYYSEENDGYFSGDHNDYNEKDMDNSADDATEIGSDMVENFPENEEQTDAAEYQTELETEKYVETQGQDGIDTNVLPSASISKGESGETTPVPPEKTAKLFELVESAWESEYSENVEESEKTVSYTITFLSSAGEEKYFLSSDGFIKKSHEGQWKKLSEDKQKELESFISEYSGNV